MGEHPAARYTGHYIPSLPFSAVLLALMISSLVTVGKTQDTLLLEFVLTRDERLPQSL